MNKQIKALTIALGACMVLASGSAMADSTYGYNAAGTGPVTATAKVNITVAVPLLVLLRVGSTTVGGDTVAMQGVFAIPGGPATPTAGNSQAATWDGTAPVMTQTSTPANVTAYGWTNSSGGAKVTCAVTTAFAGASGLTGASIGVASTVVAGGGLAHPGTDTTCGAASTTIARNTLVSSTWAYSLTAAGLLAANPGSSSETVTYTATTL